MSLAGTMLGVVLDLIGILFSTSGNLMMRWVANRDQKKLAKNPEYKKPKEWKDPVWWLIVILLFGNGAIDFAAFQFATMTILAPLASVSIVLNSVVAYFLLGEKFTFQQGVGSFIMICGATMTIVSGPPEAEHIVTVYTVWMFFIRTNYLLFEGLKISMLILSFFYVKFVPVIELETHKTPKQEQMDAAEASEEQANYGAVTNSGIPVVNRRLSAKVLPTTDSFAAKQEPSIEIVPAKRSSQSKEEHKEESETDSQEPKKEPDKEEKPEEVHPEVHPDAPQDKTDDLTCQCKGETPCRCKAAGLTRSSSASVLPQSSVEIPTRKVTGWRKVLYTQGHIIVWSFIVSGVGSYTNLTGKIFVKLVAASTAGVQQFEHWGAYLMAVLLICSAIVQLHLMKVCLARFESIVIMPSLNCMYILHLMCEGGMFFDEFGHFGSELYELLFALSIVIAFAGIAVASAVKEKKPSHPRSSVSEIVSTPTSTGT